MEFLRKTDLLKKAERRYCEFPVVVCGEKKKCRIQSLTEKERSDYEAEMQVAKGRNKAERMKDAKRRLIVLCVVDENNSPMLTQQDVKELEQVDSSVTGEIFNRCIEHVGFGGDDIEDLVGNSEGIDED